MDTRPFLSNDIASVVLRHYPCTTDQRMRLVSQLLTFMPKDSEGLLSAYDDRCKVERAQRLQAAVTHLKTCMKTMLEAKAQLWAEEWLANDGIEWEFNVSTTMRRGPKGVYKEYRRDEHDGFLYAAKGQFLRRDLYVTVPEEFRQEPHLSWRFVYLYNAVPKDANVLAAFDSLLEVCWQDRLSYQWSNKCAGIRPVAQPKVGTDTPFDVKDIRHYMSIRHPSLRVRTRCHQYFDLEENSRGDEHLADTLHSEVFLSLH